jgi:hypothetical protein
MTPPFGIERRLSPNGGVIVAKGLLGSKSVPKATGDIDPTPVAQIEKVLTNMLMKCGVSDISYFDVKAIAMNAVEYALREHNALQMDFAGAAKKRRIDVADKATLLQEIRAEIQTKAFMVQGSHSLAIRNAVQRVAAIMGQLDQKVSFKIMFAGISSSDWTKLLTARSTTSSNKLDLR